ncbi:MAG: hypothetical protein ACRDJN_19695 [Chloroflexota bacterium]
MPQLNPHIPEGSDLLSPVEAQAKRLGLSPSALARAVLEVALEPYVPSQVEVRQREGDYSAQAVAALRHRFSGALPARPLLDDTLDSAEAGPDERADEAGAEAVGTAASFTVPPEPPPWVDTESAARRRPLKDQFGKCLWLVEVHRVAGAGACDVQGPRALRTQAPAQ